MRSCYCRPCPWTAWSCGAERLSTGVFLVLPPTCVLSAKSQSSCGNFSAFTVSQPIRVCLRKQWEPSRLPRAVFMGCASVASSNIHFTSHAIMHKSQWKCSVSALLLFLHKSKNEEIVCCGLSDRVRVCACVRFQNRARRWAGLWASALNTADQWITRAKAADKVQPVTDRTVDPSSPSVLTSVSEKRAESPPQPEQTRPFGKTPPLVL